MPWSIVTEWLARIEHKLDILVKSSKPGMAVNTPMHFIGTVCPACSNVIEYQIDPQHQVVTRKCGCKTGKVPVTIPLVPTQEGLTNAQHHRDHDESPQDRDRREAR